MFLRNVTMVDHMVMYTGACCGVTPALGKPGVCVFSVAAPKTVPAGVFDVLASLTSSVRLLPLPLLPLLPPLPPRDPLDTVPSRFPVVCALAIVSEERVPVTSEASVVVAPAITIAMQMNAV